jgi:hypothetical protein
VGTECGWRTASTLPIYACAADPQRGTGEGHYPWDLRPQSTMTNANVEQVGAIVDGRTLTLKYKGGQMEIFVPADTPIVIYELGAWQISSPAPRSSSSPPSSPTERSRVVRGALAAMAPHQPSDRVRVFAQDGLRPAFPGEPMMSLRRSVRWGAVRPRLGVE